MKREGNEKGIGGKREKEKGKEDKTWKGAGKTKRIVTGSLEGKEQARARGKEGRDKSRQGGKSKGQEKGNAQQRQGKGAAKERAGKGSGKWQERERERERD